MRIVLKILFLRYACICTLNTTIKHIQLYEVFNSKKVFLAPLVKIRCTDSKNKKHANSATIYCN